MTRREFGALAAAGAANQLTAAEKESLMYVGTYTRGGSKGIYGYKFNPATGKLTEAGVAAEVQNPSFLYVTPDGRHLYAVGEASTGMVTAYKVDRAAGKLTKLNDQPTGGNGPCHLAADKAGRNLIIVHYGSGNVSVFRLNSDGSVGERTALVQNTGEPGADKKRQDKAHAHSVNLSKSEKYAVVADLGLDEYIVYALDAAKGTLTEHSAAKIKPGSGPRHFNFHPNYKFAYGVNELSSTVTAFDWDELAGKLTEKQTISTLPADFKGTSYCAEILVHPGGKYVYASNRGHDSLAMFSIASDGKLTSLGTVSVEGKTPRNFRIHPSGAWVVAANQDSGNLVVFKVDKSAGKLTATGDQAKVPFPVCIKFIV
jgi:6-phosphogluconolactonase